MKSDYRVVMILALVVLFGCEKQDEPVNTKGSGIIGYWIDPVADDTIITYTRANGLKDNDYGFAFKAEQVFTERKNAGWCGTPPISYADFDGTWTQTNSLIGITVDYWGGTADYQWKIISVDSHKLTVYRMKEEFHYRNE